MRDRYIYYMRSNKFILIALAFFIMAGVLGYLFYRMRNAPPPAGGNGKEPSAVDGQGRAEIVPPNPVYAGELNTWTIVYTAEKAGIPKGGGVALQISPWWEWSPPQNYRPSAPGYTTASTEAFGVELELSTNSERRYALAIIKKGKLKPGQKITFVYGVHDQSGDGRARADIFAEREEKFFIKTDGNGDGFFVTLADSPEIRILGGPPAQLMLTAPSWAVVGRPFKVAVAALDKVKNRSAGYTGTIEVRSIGISARVPEKIIIPPESEGAAFFEVTAHEEGLARFEVEDALIGLSAISNPVKVTTATPEYKLYWADLHGHTNLSDGTGTPEDYYRYAREVALLDVAVVTDHDHWGFMPLDEYPEAWDRIKAVTKAAHKPGEFVTLLGYEFTDWQEGHYHVLYPGDDGPLYSSSNPETENPKLLWEALGDRDAITVPHHTGGGPVPTDWNYYNRRFEPLVEIVNVHGVSERYDAWGAIYNPKRGHFAVYALAMGYRMGFVGSGDSHDGHPGTRNYRSATGGVAGIWARELTRKSIWEALKARRTYASTNARIYLTFSVNGAFMGEDLELENESVHRNVKATIIGTSTIATVELVKNGQVVALQRPDNVQYEFEYTDPDIANTGDYYYLRVSQSDNEFAWSSPVWIDVPGGQ